MQTIGKLGQRILPDSATNSISAAKQATPAKRFSDMDILDLRECAKSGMFYGGRAGKKEGIVYKGAHWIA